MADTSTNKHVKELEELYLSGKYDELKSKLIKDRDSLSPGVFHYNLGTVFAKQGNLAAARYNLEKAKSLGFEHPALNKNLSSILKTVEIQTNPEIPASSKALNYFMGTSEGLFLLFSLVLILFVSILYRMKLFRNKIVLALSIVICLSPLGVKKYYYNTNYVTGVNIRDAKVFEGPSEIYPTIKEIVGGQKLILGKSYEDWIFIASPIEFSGWIKRKDLGIL
jgi:hypothetical protein